jgi:acid stress-induced BolA-like protein IbaG/YrbA
MMTAAQIKQNLENIASDLGLRDPRIQAERAGKWIHVLISSQDFSGKSAGERDNLIWRELEKRFDDETILAITQCYLLTPREYDETIAVGS